MEGSQLDITFNAKYLIDALKNMDFEDLVFAHKNIDAATKSKRLLSIIAKVI